MVCLGEGLYTVVYMVCLNEGLYGLLERGTLLSACMRNSMVSLDEGLYDQLGRGTLPVWSA